MKKIVSYLCIGIFISSSCKTPEGETIVTGNHYAHRFSIIDHDKYQRLKVINPWQGSGNEIFEYLLAEDLSLLPDSLSEIPAIKTPVSRVVVFSTTHIGFIRSLGYSTSITGVSGLSYVCDSIIRNRASSSMVYDIGYPPNVNYERIISLDPDVVFLYGIEANITGIAGRLQKAGIPVVLIAEYLEPHPLGKMEWIKVFGAFYHENLLARAIFEDARKEYEKYQKLADSVKNKPGVLVGLPWKDTWYMAGGASFTARFIRDAGGLYLWEENPSTEYIPLSLEAAMTKALEADIWINTGSAASLEEIMNRDTRFSDLEVFRKKKVFNNDALLCPEGGNQFWESGVTEPHIILKDLIKIFHPEIMEPHDFVYYRKLK